MNKPMVESLIVVGYDEDGDVRMDLSPSINPASVVVLLEQMKLNLVGQFRFKHAPKVIPAPAMNGLKGRTN